MVTLACRCGECACQVADDVREVTRRWCGLLPNFTGCFFRWHLAKLRVGDLPRLGMESTEKSLSTTQVPIWQVLSCSWRMCVCVSALPGDQSSSR